MCFIPNLLPTKLWKYFTSAASSQEKDHIKLIIVGNNFKKLFLMLMRILK